MLNKILFIQTFSTTLNQNNNHQPHFDSPKVFHLEALSFELLKTLQSLFIARPISPTPYLLIFSLLINALLFALCSMRRG